MTQDTEPLSAEELDELQGYVEDDFGKYTGGLAMRLIAELRQHRAASPTGAEGWRDIASAPRDGTKVDLWIAPHPKNLSGNGGERVSECWFAYGEWRYHDGFAAEGFNNLNDEQVVHWMPLPSPPTPGETT